MSSVICVRKTTEQLWSVRCEDRLRRSAPECAAPESVCWAAGREPPCHRVYMYGSCVQIQVPAPGGVTNIWYKG